MYFTYTEKRKKNNLYQFLLVALVRKFGCHHCIVATCQPSSGSSRLRVNLTVSSLSSSASQRCIHGYQSSSSRPSWALYAFVWPPGSSTPSGPGLLVVAVCDVRIGTGIFRLISQVADRYQGFLMHGKQLPLLMRYWSWCALIQKMD